MVRNFHRETRGLSPPRGRAGRGAAPGMRSLGQRSGESRESGRRNSSVGNDQVVKSGVHGDLTGTGKKCQANAK